MQVVAALEEKDLDKDLRARVQHFKGALGVVPASVRTMAHRPELADAFVTLSKAVMTCNGNLTPEQKRLIGYTVSFASGCMYCQAHTILASQRFGASEERLNNVLNYDDSPHYTEPERAALAYAYAAACVPNAVTPAIVTRLKKHWSDLDIVEITGVIAFFGFLNRWNDSMGTTLEDMPIEAGVKYLASTGWEIGKHE